MHQSPITTTTSANQPVKNLIASLEGGIISSEALQGHLLRIPTKYWNVEASGSATSATLRISTTIALDQGDFYLRFEQRFNARDESLDLYGEIQYPSASSDQTTTIELSTRPKLITDTITALLPLLADEGYWDKKFQECQSEARQYLANTAWTESIIAKIHQDRLPGAELRLDEVFTFFRAELNSRKNDDGDTFELDEQKDPHGKHFEVDGISVDLYFGRVIQIDQHGNDYPFNSAYVLLNDQASKRSFVTEYCSDFSGEIYYHLKEIALGFPTPKE